MRFIFSVLVILGLAYLAFAFLWPMFVGVS